MLVLLKSQDHVSAKGETQDLVRSNFVFCFRGEVSLQGKYPTPAKRHWRRHSSSGNFIYMLVGFYGAHQDWFSFGRQGAWQRRDASENFIEAAGHYLHV